MKNLVNNLKRLYNSLLHNSTDALPPLKPIIPCPFDGKESILRYNGYLSYYYIECTVIISNLIRNIFLQQGL
jgi:hypothetical protein